MICKTSGDAIKLQNKCCAEKLLLHDIMFDCFPHVVSPRYCLEAAKGSVRTEIIRVNVTVQDCTGE